MFICCTFWHYIEANIITLFQEIAVIYSYDTSTIINNNITIITENVKVVFSLLVLFYMSAP